MIRLIYKSVQKATKEVDGVTQVTLDTDGTLVELGNVTVKKGSKNFKAVLLDSTILDGKYTTKKQAGGALQKYFNGADKTAAPRPVAAAPIEEPAMVEVTPEPKPEPVVEAAPEPVMKPIKPAYVIPFTMGDVLLDEGFDSEGYPEMPAFLRRDLWSDDEREFNSAKY